MLHHPAMDGASESKTEVIFWPVEILPATQMTLLKAVAGKYMGVN